MQHGDHVLVARHHPRMKKWIPMNRIVLAQRAKQRIGIRQNLRIEKAVQAQICVVHQFSVWLRSSAASSSDMDSSRAISNLSMCIASCPTVGDSKRLRSVN